MMNKGINSPTNLTNDRHQNPEHDNLHCEIYHEGPNLEKLVVGYSFYLPQRSCGQGNIFTPVCHSVHRGGSASVHAGIPPQSRHPPQEQTLPQSRHHPPLGADTPQSRHPPKQTPPKQTPPWKQTLAYSLRAAGTHPTGMHSCFVMPMLSNHSNAWRVSNRSVQNYVQVCIPVGCIPPTC